MAIPGFIIIGAMKAGTTSLFNVLRTHPEVNMCLVKESNFFKLPEDNTGGWDLGMDWYRNLFRQTSGLTGECSTSYTKFPVTLGVAPRIHATNPDVRLIYLVRNPIDRAISHYLHNVMAGLEKRPISAALVPNANHYLLTSMYFMQLQQYLTLFPRDQICVLVCEALWANPREILDCLCDFLEIDRLSLPQDQMIRVNATLVKVTEQISDEPSNEAKELLRAAIESGSIREDASARHFASTLGFGAEKRQRLIPRFVDDLRSLCAYLGHSIEEWSDDFPLE